MRPLFPPFALLLSLLAALPWAARAAPTISNVRAVQRTDGSGIVDITYDLTGFTGTAIIGLEISNDGGATYSITPSALRLSGDIGVVSGMSAAGVGLPSTRTIHWDVARDRPEIYWPNCRARVTVSGAGETINFTLGGNIPLALVKIPPGSFTMGSIDEGWSESDENGLHQVTMNYDYYIGKHELTQAQWSAVMGTNPSNCSYGCGPDFPVQNVSWDDIQLFLTAINGLGLGGTFRLPSESEWERAARGGTQTRFHFPDSGCLPTDCTNVCTLGLYAVYCANDTGRAVRVGTKLPNQFGLYDTMGNVWEWVADDYHSSYAGAPADGSAWVDNPRATSYRVLRGCAWHYNPASCRPAERDKYSASIRYHGNGIRLAWTP